MRFKIYYLVAITLILTSFSKTCPAQDFAWRVHENGKQGSGTIQLLLRNQTAMESPKEGLWSFAADWTDNAPSDWKHIAISKVEKSGPWTLVSGQTKQGSGELRFRDAYIPDCGMLKCIRRIEYQGKDPLKKITLSVRWKVQGHRQQTFLPGTICYGNPSGEKNGADRVAVWHGRKGEFAFFEEHRYPMPFACLEDAQDRKGTALHTLPSPVLRGSVPDQWWSMGVRATADDESEIALYSGFIGYNGQNSVAKALQRQSMKYPESNMTILPGTVIEKTFWLDVWQIDRKGTAFQRPIEKSLDLFRPFYADDFPSRQEILQSKFAFARDRWLEGPNYAGFNFYPKTRSPRIVMGWCGQADSLGYALQVLEPDLIHEEKDPADRVKLKQWIVSAVQKSLDHLSDTPFNKNGFAVIYDVSQKKWLNFGDHVSMGQAMYNFAKAIEKGRTDNRYKTAKWEAFLRKSADLAAKRILDNNWHPISTAEGFYIAPLTLASVLFENETYRKAAVRAAEHYADRHLDMSEPYWGGTLDATCEDKEGAWAAFQGFLTLYETTKERKYLDWAKHAGDVCLSYLVVWDIPLPPGRLSDHNFKTRGWTSVSAQNQHLDVYGVLFAPEIRKLGKYLDLDSYRKVSEVMFRSCGQLIDPRGSQGEQIQETNFAQHGDMSDVLKLRGGYAESWTVFWITAHFLNSAARQKETN
ncbi:MAG: hypothetical protein Q4G69_05725 [Planctomycetia bacterium]|nr:hypothetical protein [Planctomycetia bacterium]